jgi:hypothetical protein
MTTTYDVVRMTPELASEWLARPSIHQRRTARNVIAGYARAMREGRWREPSIDPIALTPDGALLNGQHRLRAVIAAEWSGDMLIARDVDPALFPTIDTGRRRHAAQLIDTPNAIAVASIVRMVLWYDQRRPAHPRGAALSFDNDELLAYILEHEEPLVEAARDAGMMHNAAGLPRSTGGAAVYLAHREGADEELVAAFVNGVASGAELGAEDPRLHLRNRFLVSMPYLKRDSSGAWLVTVRALNAWLQQRPLSKLVYDTDALPPAIELVPPREDREASIERSRRRRETARGDTTSDTTGAAQASQETP